MRSDCLTSLALEIKFASSPKLRIEELPVNGHILGYEVLIMLLDKDSKTQSMVDICWCSFI